MSLFHFLLAGLGVFALLQFLLIPRVRHRLRIDRTVTAIPRAALLAVLGWVRGVALVTTLTTAALLLVVAVLGRFGGATAADLGPVIERLHAWRDRLVGFGPYWGSGVLLLLVVGLGIYAYRSSKRRMETAFRRVYEQEMERIRRQIENGTLEELPPTPAMEGMAENGRKILELLQQLQNDPSVPESERPGLQAHLEQKLGLCRQYWVMLDVERRMNLKLDPDDAEFPTPRTRWEKVQTFFMSQGLLACLGRGSRALYLASLLLLVPCLMGVYSPKVVGALKQRAVTLDDLRLRLHYEEALGEWRAAKEALGSPVAPLTEDDRQVLRQVARHYERGLANLDLVREAQAPRLASFEFRAQAAREEILKRGIAHAPVVEGQKLLHQHPAVSRAPNLEPRERVVAKAYEAAAEAHAPRTAMGRQVLTELEDAAARSPKLVERLRGQLASFQRPATGAQLGTELSAQVLDVFVGGEHPDAGLLLHDVNRKAVGEVLGPVLEARSKRFLSELTRGSSLEDALRVAQVEDQARPLLHPAQMAELKQTMRTVVGNLPPEQQVLSKMASHPPSVDVNLEPHVNIKQVSKTVEGLKQRGTLGEAALPRLVEPVTTYRDEFPSHLSALKPTVRAELETKFLPKELSAPAPAAGKLLPSRNIDALRRLPRVGGVLIGQEPAAGSTLNLTDLRWEVSGPSVRLVLVGPEKQEFRSRSYPKSLVYHALNYAADGRKVTVTICEAYPLKEASILLHPTLVDTPLGSRVIELDQLINRFAGEDPLYKKMTQQFEAQMVLYHWAWAKRPLAVGDADATEFGRLIEDKRRAEFLKGVGQLKEMARSLVVASDPRLLAEAVAARDSLGDPKRCPLTAQKKYFDEKLVQRMLAASAQARTFEEFDRAFTDGVQAEYRELLKGYRSGWQLVDGAVRQTEEIKRRADVVVRNAQVPGPGFGRPPAVLPEILDPGPHIGIGRPPVDPFDPFGRPNPGRNVGMGRRRQVETPEAALQRLEQEHNAAVGRARQGEEALKTNYLRFVNWLTPPPRYGLRNIVKERPFKAEMSQLVFADGADAPVPFDFFLQMVFTDGPAFGGKNPQEAASANDGWWVFTALTDTIETRVREGVAKDEKARTVLNDVTEFTQLQRLFQAALLGRLGKDFPVEKLVALADATAPGPRQTPTRTLRWDLREGQGDIFRGYQAASLLNLALRQFDPAWDPDLFRKTDPHRILESPDLAAALEGWPATLLRQMERLEEGSADGRRWCLETTRNLGPYFALLAESVRKHQAFRKAALAVRERGAKQMSDAEKAEWKKTREEFLEWKKAWARKGEENKSRHTLSRPPTGLTKQGPDKMARRVEQIGTLVRLMEEISAAQEIRQAVDVARDERQALEELILPLSSLD
jgi:hypothetical protein